MRQPRSHNKQKMETPETARGRWPLCQVCAGEFDWPRAHHSDEDRLFARCPRLLSCLHTVCEACLHDARERRGTYACHVCQARTNVRRRARHLQTIRGLVGRRRL